MCAASVWNDYEEEGAPPVISCDGGRTWFETQPAMYGTDVFVDADGGLMYVTAFKEVWSFPLMVVLKAPRSIGCPPEGM
jgi:hypothetical protein